MTTPVIWLRFRSGHDHAFRAGHAVRSACGAVVVPLQADAYPPQAAAGEDERRATVRVAKPKNPCSHCVAAIWKPRGKAA